MNTEDIARRAYGIWEMADRPQGNAVEHWLQAEAELAGLRQDPPADAGAPVQIPKRLRRKKVARPAARRPKR